jgi:hypothetical protein
MRRVAARHQHKVKMTAGQERCRYELAYARASLTDANEARPPWLSIERTKVNPDVSFVAKWSLKPCQET